MFLLFFGRDYVGHHYSQESMQRDHLGSFVMTADCLVDIAVVAMMAATCQVEQVGQSLWLEVAFDRTILHP